jgi:hypothetical protein
MMPWIASLRARASHFDPRRHRGRGDHQVGILFGKVTGWGQPELEVERRYQWLPAIYIRRGMKPWSEFKADQCDYIFTSTFRIPEVQNL